MDVGSCPYFHQLPLRLLRRLLLMRALTAALAASPATKGRTGLASSFIRSLATLEAKIENKRKKVSVNKMIMSND